ncbi:MAG: hypothetical protein DHS20C13_26540 [Thermodesulfobacteriota bacterium]|nr:MAG: hypothetical protein DHS20C13_26540 [Thermodesulfobacteriota bacterium]
MCLNPGQKTDFSIADDNDLDLPANCGVGVINTSQSKSARDASLATLPNPLNTYQLGIYCGACKPKYKPTYTTKND